MSHYIEKVTVSLENLISELARNPSLFLKNPDTDFSRNRKINFKTCVGITMNSGGCTLNKELLDFFDFDVNAPTVSAYTQQRAKILPEAFEYLFHAFTEENAQTKNLYEGYQLLACDGSNLTIAPNLNDPETLWKSNQLGATGNHLHLNALTSFHAKKVDYIKQEIFARLALYNYCELITTYVVEHTENISKKNQVNFTIAIYICREYLRRKRKLRPPDVVKLIEKHILPIRPGRRDPRKVKLQASVSFLYRVA